MAEEKKITLEEAAEEYRQGEVDTGCDYIDDSDGDSLYYSACLANAFIAGAEWQKEQMLKEAVEASVNYYENIPGGSYVELVTDILNPTEIRYEDKVKVIIVKEAEK